MQHLFVYGTLLFPDIIKELTLKQFDTKTGLLKGFQRSKVKGADYPAMVTKENSEVIGKLLLNVDQDSLDIITFFEGDDYKKSDVSILTGNDTVNAVAFIWDKDPDYLCGQDWDVQEFESKCKEVYLNDVVPNTRSAFALSRFKY